MDLSEARILIAGATGAGAAVAGHLAAAGAGYVAIADGGKLEPADLPLQLLHFAPDVGSNRAESLAAKLGFLNAAVQADPYPVRIESANAAAIAAGHDVVVEATGDNLSAMPLVHACAQLEVPLVHVRLLGPAGVVLVTVPGRTACLGCAEARLDGLPAGTAAHAGWLSGMLGAAAAADVAALLSDSAPEHAVLRIASVPPQIRVERVDRNPECELCGERAAVSGVAAEARP